MKVISSTPTRIDLAGGTLDIHPLYLFEQGGLTVNLAISLRSRVEMELRDDNRIHIYSEDLDERIEAANLEELPQGGALDLITRAVRFYRPGRGINLVTRNSVPRGSGLGASSSLLMALSGALSSVLPTPMNNENLINWGANLEAQNLGIPTGKQDYYAAIHGGLNALWFNVKGAVVENLTPYPGFAEALAERLILTFTGVSHFSATNNWNMLRRYIEDEQGTRKALARIKDTAHHMREALLAGDWNSLAVALDEEWENRRSLAPGVSTDVIEHLMKSAREAGALASKICGAGGGGCMVTLVEPPDRERVVAALEKAGGQVLPFLAESTGILIEGYPVRRQEPMDSPMPPGFMVRPFRMEDQELPRLMEERPRQPVGRFY